MNNKVMVINEKTRIVFGAATSGNECEGTEIKQEVKHLSEEDLRGLYAATEGCTNNLLDMIRDLAEQNAALKQENRVMKKEVKRMDELCADLERKNMVLETENRTLRESLETAMNRKRIKNVLTVEQQVIFFYYLFDELGVNFANSDKAEWARLIHRVTGSSEARLRNLMTINFDEKNTLRNIRVVSDICSELFPKLVDKMKNDTEL